MDDTTGTDSGDEEPGAGSEGLGAPVEQFQQAALDAVHAARAFLDAAERMIEEPAALEAVVDTVNAVVRQATGAVADFAGRARDQATGTSASGDDGDEPPTGYESIQVD